MLHTNRQCGEEGTTAPLQPQEDLTCHLTPSQTFIDAQLRASCRAVTLPGMATALPTTTRLSRGWCGLHNASLGQTTCPPGHLYHEQPPKPLPVHPTTIQKARSVQVHQSLDRETEKQLLSQVRQTVKQLSLTQRCRCLHANLKSLATIINGSLFILIICICVLFRNCETTC